MKVKKVKEGKGSGKRKVEAEQLFCTWHAKIGTLSRAHGGPFLLATTAQ